MSDDLPKDVEAARSIAVLAAVIELAARDAVGVRRTMRVTKANCASARAYFASKTYQEHLATLGLPPDSLPAVLAAENQQPKERRDGTDAER